MKNIIILFAILISSVAQAQVKVQVVETPAQSFSRNFNEGLRNGAAVASAAAANRAAGIAADNARGWDFKTRNPWHSMRAEGKHIINFRGKIDFDLKEVNYLNDTSEYKIEFFPDKNIVSVIGKIANYTYVFKYEIYNDNIILTVHKIISNKGKNIYEEGKRSMPRKAYKYLGAAIKIIANALKTA